MMSTAGQKTLPAYLVGFFTSLLLTCLAFALVSQRYLDGSQLYLALGLLALAQLLVQSLCFLRLNTSREGMWNTLPYLFTLLIIFIAVAGSLWVMANLDYNMMH